MLTLNSKSSKTAIFSNSQKFPTVGRKKENSRVLKAIILSEMLVATGFLPQKKHPFGVLILEKKWVKKVIF